MREIKFRAWDGKKMLYMEPQRYVCIADLSWGLWEGDDPLVGTGWDRPNAKKALMQFTGLVDKNGVKIYEGDILRHGAHTFEPMVVVWDQGTCSFDLQDQIGDYGYSEHLFDSTGENDHGNNIWEVAGNIYQNPELLK